MQAVIYCRTAATPQGHPDPQLAEQERLGRQHCARRGHEVAAVITDASLSGSRSNVRRSNAGWLSTTARQRSASYRRSIVSFATWASFERG
jgi:hypothetical protein